VKTKQVVIVSSACLRVSLAHRARGLTFSSSLGNENWAVVWCSGKTALGFVAGIVWLSDRLVFSLGRANESSDYNERSTISGLGFESSLGARQSPVASRAPTNRGSGSPQPRARVNPTTRRHQKQAATLNAGSSYLTQPTNTKHHPSRMSVGDTTNTELPSKRIISRTHLEAFLNSTTHADLVEFITATNESVVQVKLTDPIEPSKASPSPLAPGSSTAHQLTG